MTATLLIAAHGTASSTGSATTRALADAVAAARPDVPVRLCFLDVVSPRLAEALDAIDDEVVVVVPLLLSAGYHVITDIPRIVAGRTSVRVARHLGPDPLLLEVVATRLAEAGGIAGTTALAVVSSTRESANAEIETARAALSDRLGRDVSLLPLSADMRETVATLPKPLAVAVYLLAEGAFLDALGDAVGSAGVVAAPIGVHPLLVHVILNRYDAAVADR